MNRLLLIALLVSYSSVVSAQQDFLVFKKKNKTIAYFRKDSYITFQLKNREWFTGYIAKVQNDTFYLNPIFVHYNMMGADTVHYAMLTVPFNDVYAMPRKGEQVSFLNERVGYTYGNEHWVWLKNGLILRLGGAGYILLYVLNGLIKNNLSFSAGKLGIAAGVFLMGELLNQTYRPTLRLGKKYHLEFIKIPG